MKRLLLFWLFFVFGLLLSCTQRESADIFDKVAGYMEIHPDSALLLLNQIKRPDELRGKQQADYALLLTQARDKNYLDSLQSDSLIRLAVHYYLGTDDRVKAGKSLFYYGKVMALRDADTVAMQAYMEAQIKLENTGEYKLMGLIQEYAGRLNDDRGMYDLALDNYKKAAKYFRKASDTLGVVYIYRNLSRIYETMHSDSAGWYAHEGIAMLKGDSTAKILPSLLHILGIIETREGNYSEAITYLEAAIRHEWSTYSLHYYSLSLGDVYLKLHQLEKARKCFENVLVSKRECTKAAAYHYLYLLEKEQDDYVKALHYKELSDSVLAIDQDEHLRSSIAKIQQNYEAKRYQLEKELLEQKNQTQFYYWLTAFCLTVIVSIASYYWLKRRYMNFFNKRLRQHIEKTARTMRENEQIIGKYICQIEELKRREVLDREMAKEQIGNLNQRILVLLNENKLLCESSCANGIDVLGKLKHGLLIAENMTSKEKQQVFNYMDLLFGNMVTRLRTEYELNDNNLILVVLIKVGFSSNELMTVFQCEMNSVFKKKQRLRSKLCLETKDELESFLASYSLSLST